MSAIVFNTVVDLSEASGSGVATRELICGLGASSDKRLLVVCPKPTGEFPARLDDSVDKFLFVPRVTNPGSPQWHLKMELSILGQLLKIFWAEDVSLVVTRLCASTLFPAIVCRLFDIPHALLIRGWVRRSGDYGETTFGRVVEQLVRMNVRLSPNVYVAFAELKQWVGPYRSESQSPIEILPNAVDPTVFSPTPMETARTDLGIDTDDFVIGFVGTLAPRHELTTLLRAVAQLDDVTLLIVGDGVLATELEQTAQDLELDDRVIFTGRVSHDDVPKYISAFDVGYGVVSPNKPSNPIKCYEYLACERPVITSKTGELEFVSEIGVGAVIETLSPDKVRDGIEKLRRQSREERVESGRRGRSYVCQHFTWEGMAEKIISAN